ncbi:MULTISPECIES: acyltransferase family protein [unclassified Robiginitalea]|uniref:acyltransferase family protein n=1 Tax=Robiginitalea TaxID=252306 RepID=UPI00234A0333|nr:MULTISPECIES: acyltransferase [unclassified Robiginitalea]MDC6354871.1 acyltransferase [Robiginitalea sp. PM2]MDC6375137.1 acyltransferase [Robiginitalea sp. SP8]
MKIPGKWVSGKKYREDIDGLRAIAVIAVIAFHFGYLPAGYLGVDVFFVISGFLITGIIYRGFIKGQFSIRDFYLRRIKRIIPLVLFICLVSLCLGMIFMLPDDLENLAQSVIATNFFNNNTLQILTTKNYWDVVNEYKPLMHTWSLGIEEQYYLIYPFLFVLVGTVRKHWIVWILALLTILSLVLYFAPFPSYLKFYLLPFRFFELSIGGIAAILVGRNLIRHRLAFHLALLLLIVLFAGLNFLSDQWLLFFTIVITCAILISANHENSWSSRLLENRFMVFVGKISFSLYMWHQVLLAFGRYVYFQEMQFTDYLLVLFLTIVLSVLTYYFIEEPFRRRFSTKVVLIVLTAVFLLTTGVSWHIYTQAGILKDVPELSLVKEQGERNMHARYNDRINQLSHSFSNNNRIKVLAVGNSFMRDWCNVLLESQYADSVEISYFNETTPVSELRTPAEMAEIIFITDLDKSFMEQLNVSREKVWYVGTKNFGVNNGIFYNQSGPDYCSQRTHMEEGYLELNSRLKNTWGDRYIDLIDLTLDQEKTVPVFTPDCKFISQDCRHFTKAGASYFASLIEPRIAEILYH